MTKTQKFAALLFVGFLLVIAIAARSTDYSRTQALSVSAPHVEINNAWMVALLKQDVATLNSLTCHPSESNTAALKAQIASISDILLASSEMRLVDAEKEDSATKTIKVRTRFDLRTAVRGQMEYSGIILINSSTHNYCVLGFVLDQAIWPRRQAQE